MALNGALHTIGGTHQPLHVSDQYSKAFPTGNEAGTLEWVADPVGNHIIRQYITGGDLLNII